MTFCGVYTALSYNYFIYFIFYILFAIYLQFICNYSKNKIRKSKNSKVSIFIEQYKIEIKIQFG